MSHVSTVLSSSPSDRKKLENRDLDALVYVTNNFNNKYPAPGGNHFSIMFLKSLFIIYNLYIICQAELTLYQTKSLLCNLCNNSNVRTRRTFLIITFYIPFLYPLFYIHTRFHTIFIILHILSFNYIIWAMIYLIFLIYRFSNCFNKIKTV